MFRPKPCYHSCFCVLSPILPPHTWHQKPCWLCLLHISRAKSCSISGTIGRTVCIESPLMQRTTMSDVFFRCPWLTLSSQDSQIDSWGTWVMLLYAKEKECVVEIQRKGFSCGVFMPQSFMFCSFPLSPTASPVPPLYLFPFSS